MSLIKTLSDLLNYVTSLFQMRNWLWGNVTSSTSIKRFPSIYLCVMFLLVVWYGSSIVSWLGDQSVPLCTRSAVTRTSHSCLYWAIIPEHTHTTSITVMCVISTLLYGVESWPLSVTQMKKLEAAHHKFQRRLLGITWRDKVRNEDIRKKRWLGHVLRMDNSRTARQATYWELRGYKRKPGRPRKNWADVIKRDLWQKDLTWEEAEELANDKAEWRRRVAQCSHLDAGWTKV